MLSPLLFLILIDYVSRKVNEGSRGGIQWEITSGRVEYLEYLDYAGDLDVLACTFRFEKRPKRYDKLLGVWG